MPVCGRRLWAWRRHGRRRNAFDHVDARSGPFQVYNKRSLDDGASWQSDVLLGPAQGTVQAARPTIAALDGEHSAHVIFYDTRNSDASGAKIELYYARPGG